MTVTEEPARRSLRAVGGQQGALDAPVEGALRRGHHHRPLHRLRRLRDRLPPRRHRLRARAGRLQAVPPRGGARPRRLHPRPEGLHLAAPGPAPGSAPGSPRPTSTSSPASAEPDEPSGIYQDILLTRASDDMVHQIGQDGGFVSAMLIWALDHGYIDAALTSYLEGGRRRASSWKAIPGVATNKEEILAGAGSAATRTRPTRSPCDEALERGLQQARPGRHELPVIGAAGDVEPQGRQDRQADRLQHRPALLEDLRRLDLRGALLDQVRLGQGGDGRR